MIGPVAVLGHHSIDAILSDGGKVRRSVGGPICFICSTLAMHGVGAIANSGGGWRDLDASVDVEQIAQLPGTPALHVRIHEQDGMIKPQVLVPGGLGPIQVKDTQLMSNCAYVIVSTVLAEVSLSALLRLKENYAVKIVIDLQGYQRVLDGQGLVEHVQAPHDFLLIGDIIKASSAEISRQFPQGLKQAQYFSERYNKQIIVTRGCEGMCALINGKLHEFRICGAPFKQFRREPQTTAVITPVGAGDRLLAATVAELVRGNNIVQALQRAQTWLLEFLSRSETGREV